MRKFRASEDYGVIVTNPPYGERIGRDETLQGIYQRLREILRERPTWSLFVITADKDLERVLGRKADRRRKLYNGRIETTYYQFFGEKPEPSGTPERTVQ